MDFVNFQMASIQRRNKSKSTSRLEFTPDFIRDVANKFDDIETVSNLSKVSKKFNESINFSDEKNRKHLLKLKEHTFSRHIYFYAKLNGEPCDIEENVKAYYSEYSNGLREGSYKEIRKEHDFERPSKAFKASLFDHKKGERNSENAVYQRMLKGKKINFNGILPKKISREGTYVKGKLEGILYDYSHKSLTLEYLYSNNVLKSITWVGGKNKKLFYAELEPIDEKESEEITMEHFSEFFQEIIDARDEDYGVDYKYVGVPEEKDRTFKDVMSELFVPARYYSDFMNNVLMRCTSFKNFGIQNKSYSCEETFVNDERSRITLFLGRKIVETVNDVNYTKRIFYEGKEIFWYKQRNQKVSGKCKSVKISGTIDCAKEEYFENGEKVGEINYDTYYDFNLYKNKLSKKEESTYKDMKIKNISVRDSENNSNYLKTIYVSSAKPIVRHAITLEEQF